MRAIERNDLDGALAAETRALETARGARAWSPLSPKCASVPRRPRTGAGDALRRGEFPRGITRTW